jgi:phenylacetate-CoA ligase
VQLVVGHTPNDLRHWARLAARQLVAAGGPAHDVIQVSFGGSPFNQALGYLLGAEVIEASVIPQDAHHVDYQLAMMQSYRPSILITTPTQALDLLQLTRQRKLDPQGLQLRTILLTRPVPPAIREELKAGLFADVHCSFGIAEVLDPGICIECTEGHLHIQEDEFIAETDNGELLLTTLTREAMPLVRYRTQLRAELQDTPCPCGRTGRILVPGERLDGRLRVNEMPLYRSQIETVLQHTRLAGHPFNLTISDRKIDISIQVTRDLFPDTVREMEDLKSEITSECFTRLGIPARISYVAPGRAPRT